MPDGVGLAQIGCRFSTLYGARPPGSHPRLLSEALVGTHMRNQRGPAGSPVRRRDHTEWNLYEVHTCTS